MVDLLPDAVVRYGDADDLLIDLHLPPAPTGTLVVLVHGGFWKQRYDRTHTREQARALADAGFLVATPEYRRVGGGGGWPTTATDLETAVRRLPDLLNGLGLTVGRAVMTGHSAGGHLALWLLTRDLPIAFDTVVSMAGVIDLVRAEELDLGDGAVAALLAGAPIADADPMTLLGPTSARIVLVHGEEDDTVPVDLSLRFHAAHPDTTLVALPGADHYGFLDPADPAWQVVLDALR